MSSIILPKIGAFLGSSALGPIGGALGQSLGSSLGQEVDQQLFFKNNSNPIIGLRLAEITMQTATYGKMIPIIYGTVKIAGNIIWASEILEHRQDHYQRRGKFSGKSLVASQYNYSISLAIAICEGEVNKILRVWADDRLIDPRRCGYRFYSGSETQMPDHLIEAHQGLGKTPAFRGTAYIVIEDLPLAEFGNRIPNFIFEVKCKVKTYNSKGEVPLEERIKAMVIIPGSGEFVYDTEVQCKVPKNYNPKYGTFNLQKTKVNQNNRENQADSVLALKQLAETCPNLEWVSPVVGWFTSSLNADDCKILPGIEYSETNTLPDQWQVAGFNRDNAHLISKNKFSNPIYGGTSNDASIMRYLDRIKEYNYKIMFYPMLFVDLPNKPWRGNITGTPEGVKDFFKEYNPFILHYANLVKDKVDAFLIGSEMIGLTKVRAEDNSFPAVDQLVELAKQVKKIMGDKVKISYAANWSEYHHSEGGWYNLDKLWACDYIDFVGIDAYFSLTNETNNFYNEDKIIEGWQSGEGFDYYYEDEFSNNKQPLEIHYAWKNIAYWWSHEHINPDGIKTAWQSKQKKIWFTEIGFPSVDLASNQPNVFYSPDSSESAFPIHSKGNVDFAAQRQALSATEKYWRDSEFIEQLFIWTWDARPFPYWPDLSNIWQDGDCWLRGHWVNGKLGLTKLEAIIQDLCKRSGMDIEQVKAEELCDFVDGLVINRQDSAKNIINLLKSAYFFDSHESDSMLHFIKRLNRTSIKIDAESLVADNGHEKQALLVQKICPSSLSKSVAVHYMNYLSDYEEAVEFASNYCNSAEQITSLHLPIIMDPQKAKTIAEITLQETWQNQLLYKFTLMPNHVTVKPNDVIHLKINDEISPMRVISSKIDIGRVNKITAMAIRENTYHIQTSSEQIKDNTLLTKDHFDPGETELIILNLPRLPYEVAPYGVYIGVQGNNEHWRGAEVECPDGSLMNFNYNATVGIVEVNEDDCIEVIIISGELFSKTTMDIEKYANLAALGKEVIQFTKAEFLGEGRYCLTELKRELFGSKKSESQKFILLDNALQKLPINEQLINIKQTLIATSIGHNIEQSKEFEFTYS